MATLFLRGLEQAYKGGIVVGTDTFSLAFMSTSYTPDAVNEEYWSDISANIASGTTVRTLSGVSIIIDGANSRIAFDANNVSETPVTTSTNKFVLFKNTGTPTTSTLVGCFDITEGTLNVTGGEVAVNFSANGIFGISATPA